MQHSIDAPLSNKAETPELVITSAYDWTHGYNRDPQCGEYGTGNLVGDISGDCYVKFDDFALFAATWLDCDEPSDPNCI